jgi:hypothetical protein
MDVDVDRVESEDSSSDENSQETTNETGLTLGAESSFTDKTINMKGEKTKQVNICYQV